VGAAIFVYIYKPVDGSNMIFGHKRHIGTPYRGKRCWTHQIPTSCLPILLIFTFKEDLPATSKQQTRQTRHRSTSVGEKGRSASVSTKKTPVQKKNYHCTSY
jgi:hypothetical protein